MGDKSELPEDPQAPLIGIKAALKASSKREDRVADVEPLIFYGSNKSDRRLPWLQQTGRQAGCEKTCYDLLQVPVKLAM